ncbi:hypothetical protein ACS0TY_000802 [Phlomoides rotata]
MHLFLKFQIHVADKVAHVATPDPVPSEPPSCSTLRISTHFFFNLHFTTNNDSENLHNRLKVSREEEDDEVDGTTLKIGKGIMQTRDHWSLCKRKNLGFSALLTTSLSTMLST